MFGKNRGALGDPDKANRSLATFENPLVNANAISDAMENQKKRFQEFQSLLEPRMLPPGRRTRLAASFVQDLFGRPPQTVRDDPFGRDQSPASPTRRAKVDPMLGVINQTPASLDLPACITPIPPPRRWGCSASIRRNFRRSVAAPQIVDVFPQRKF